MLTGAGRRLVAGRRRIRSLAEPGANARRPVGALYKDHVSTPRHCGPHAVRPSGRTPDGSDTCSRIAVRYLVLTKSWHAACCGLVRQRSAQMPTRRPHADRRSPRLRWVGPRHLFFPLNSCGRVSTTEECSPADWYGSDTVRLGCLAGDAAGRIACDLGGFETLGQAPSFPDVPTVRLGLTGR